MKHPDLLTARRIPAYRWGNPIGTFALYRHEVMRFLHIYAQAVVAPALNAALFMLIFNLALGSFRPDVNGVSFARFLAPGLIIMAIVQNAFANPSFALLLGKIQGNIVDLLMPPLSAGEINCALALGGLTRGLVVGLMTGLMLAPFVDLSISRFGIVLYYSVGGALLLSSIGILCGIWSEKFEHLNSTVNFFITPLTLLSGTFYSISQLPDVAAKICLYNPFFYIIDGFRYGFTGQHESNIAIGMTMLAVLNVIAWTLSQMALKSGFRLKQ